MTSLTCLLIVCILAMNFVPSAAFCLDYKYCYNEDFLNYDKLEIHHEDHEERSATTCAMLCLREDPETLLVFAKVIDMNERLVCGCGGQAALGNGSGTMDDFFSCKTCPDSEEKCGGESSISVYLILHKEGECDEPETTTRQTTTTPTKVVTVETTQPSTHINLFQLGCYTDGDVQEELAYLNVPEATVNACAATCNRVYPKKDLYLVKRNGTGLLCGCGHESSLSDSTQVAESECDFRCSDSLPCGGRDSFSAYGNSGWVARSSWTLLLVLVAALVVGR